MILVTMILIMIMIREMRCLRNKIHANLFLTFVLDCTFWMATDIMQGRELPTTGLKVLQLIYPLHYQGGGGGGGGGGG